MPIEIIVALLSLVGTAIGTFGGIVASAKLTNYRLQQLEKKVDKHNHFAERIPVIISIHAPLAGSDWQSNRKAA